MALASAVACSTHSGIVPGLQPVSSAAATPAPHGLLPLHVNGADKAGLNLRLQVAGGSPLPYLFDTGSSGLWVYFNAAGPRKNYKSTHLRTTNTYSSGIVYEGTVVRTNVAFENGLTAASVPVVIVDGAGCATKSCPAQVTAQNCPNVYKRHPRDHAGVLCLEEGRALFGTFGADIEPALVPSPSPPATAPPGPVVLYNVLFGIAPWATTFVVVAPHELQLGPRDAATAGFTYVKMSPKPLATDLPNGARSWERDVNLCYTIGSYVKRACIATVFDTGAHNVEFQTETPFAIPTQPAGCEFVVKGLAFALARGDRTTIGSFSTGYSANYNAAHLATPKPGKTPEVNTGLTFYNRDEILFDAAHGRVGLRPLPAPGHLARSGCSG
ncbi:MAG TPA: hypothetical protein VGG89_06520 [Candidatus Baltobacteraceae bacterium]